MKASIGLTTLTLIFALYIISGIASANSIHFTGLNEVNKTIRVTDLTDIADGGDGATVDIYNNDTFYFTPGHTYNFRTMASNNTTFLSDPLGWMNFFFGDEQKVLALITLIILSVFTVLLLGGGLFLVLSGFLKKVI